MKGDIKKKLRDIEYKISTHPNSVVIDFMEMAQMIPIMETYIKIERMGT